MTTNTDEAVEAAAQALFHAAYVRQPDSVRERFTEERQWSWLFSNDERNTYRTQAKAALEAAAPTIAAQALRNAADAYAEVFGRYHSGATWLRSRAYELEVGE